MQGEIVVKETGGYAPVPSFDHMGLSEDLLRGIYARFSGDPGMIARCWIAAC